MTQHATIMMQQHPTGTVLSLVATPCSSRALGARHVLGLAMQLCHEQHKSLLTSSSSMPRC